MDVRVLTEEEWEEKYRPIKNHIYLNAPRCGDMFETFGPELDFVLCQDKKYIWTWVECGEDNQTLIVDGFHRVNRLGYFVCEIAYEIESVYEVSLD